MPLKQEFYRKIFHLFLFLIPFFFIKLGKNEFLTIFIPIAIIVIAIDYYRCKFDKMNQITSRFFKFQKKDQAIYKVVNVSEYSENRTMVCIYTSLRSATNGYKYGSELYPGEMTSNSPSK